MGKDASVQPVPYEEEQRGEEQQKAEGLPQNHKLSQKEKSELQEWEKVRWRKKKQNSKSSSRGVSNPDSVLSSESVPSSTSFSVPISDASVPISDASVPSSDVSVPSSDTVLSSDNVSNSTGALGSDGVLSSDNVSSFTPSGVLGSDISSSVDNSSSSTGVLSSDSALSSVDKFPNYNDGVLSSNDGVLSSSVDSTSNLNTENPHNLQEAIALPVLEEAAAREQPKDLDAEAQSPPELERSEGIILPVTFEEAKELKGDPLKLESIPEEPKPTEGEDLTLKEKIIKRKNSLEESAHAVRLHIDAALEKKFGAQAEKVQTEMEKARLSAISGTVRFAELLQQQMGNCASDLREQQKTLKPVTTNEDKSEIKREPSLPTVGDNVVAQTFLDTHSGLEEVGHSAQEKFTVAIERKFGEKAHRWQQEGEKARESAINDTARVAELLQEELGKAASSLREQLISGPTPSYH